MRPNAQKRLKVGELAKATGLTVRTLHHYDELGLLRPSGRTDAGHRYYLPKDIERLQRIVSLRSLSMSLEQIGACLDRPRFEILPVLDQHLQALDARIVEQQRLRERLAQLADRLRSDQGATVSDLLETIEETTMFEKHFQKEQLEWLEQRKATVGEDRIREVEGIWPKLIAAVREEMQKGTDPGAPVMQEHARQWRALIDEFTGGRKDIEQGVASVNREPAARQKTGLDMEIMSFIGRAMQIAEQGPDAPDAPDAQT